MNRPSKTLVQYGALAVLIVCASCLRIFVCFQHNPLNYIFNDPWRHWMNGLRFPKGAYFGASDPIGYQVYIFALRKLTGDRAVLVALASAAMSVAMPWTYYRAARDFGLSKLASMWVWALIACAPSLLVIYHYIMMETLLLLVEGIALWMTARYLRKGTTTAFLVMIFCWTAAGLTKPTIAPVAAVCVLWAWWKKRPSIRVLAAAAVLFTAMLVPQAIRSEIALGFVAPFGNPWLTTIQHRSGIRTVYLNFYTHADPRFHFKVEPMYAMNFSSPSCYIQPLWPLSDWTMMRGRQDSKLILTINSSQGAEGWKRAYSSIHISAKEWLVQWRENIVLFLFAPSWPETAVGQWDGHLVFWARWVWAPLILVVLVFNAREFVNRRFNLIPVAVTIFTLTLGLQNMVTAEGRYGKPLEPLLLLNLVYVLTERINRRAETDATPRAVLNSERAADTSLAPSQVRQT